MRTRRRIRGVSPPFSAEASSPKSIPPSLIRRNRPYREGQSDERVRKAAGGEGRGLGAEDEARKDGRGGKVTSLGEIFRTGQRVREAEIIKKLLPDLRNDVVGVGGVQKQT